MLSTKVLAAAMALTVAAPPLALAHETNDPIPSRGLFCSVFYFLGGTCDPGEPDMPTEAGYGSISAEFMPLDDVRAALPELAAAGLAVNLEWPSNDLDNPERIQLVRDAAEVGVEVRPWLLLSYEQGYWPNSTNAEAFFKAGEELLLLWEAEALEPTRFVVDMEPSLERAVTFGELIKSGDVLATAAYLRRGIDRRQFAAATKLFARLVDDAHALGWEVEVATLPHILDDYIDGDDSIRQAFNVPIDGIDWDIVSFTVYRTLVEDALGQRPSSYYVYTYGVHARQVFGARAGLVLGLTDPGDISADAPYFTDGDEVRRDVEAARAAGIHGSRTSVYSLKGVIAQPPFSQWTQRPRTRPRPPRSDVIGDLARTGNTALDLLL